MNWPTRELEETMLADAARVGGDCECHIKALLAELEKAQADMRVVAGLVFASHKEGNSYKVWIADGSAVHAILEPYADAFFID